ncbi:magnesium transporter CorA family protein [Tepidicella baoligensis]|uniref:magnesium transporter CorA family protein n=1 Tax=Tepidicella baoligensis TaxID=2707016 RepID=UPI0015DA43B6|nr:magnesium transporter CorA family protein [Tepidicella baoligensis]
MRTFFLQGHQVREHTGWLEALPDEGFVWVAMEQPAFEAQLRDVQAMLQRLCGTTLVDLHVSDLLNPSLPSTFESTERYDMLVFRRLAQASSAEASRQNGRASTAQRPVPRGGMPVLRRIDTRPVGLVRFDRLLLSVHPPACGILDAYAVRLLAAVSQPQQETHEPGRSAPVRVMPSSPADLMLRLAGQMVDAYLDLRREFARQLDHWQTELLDPRSRFNNWRSLLDARLALHELDEISEDQRVALLDWIAALADWPAPDTPAARRERELLHVRSRDVLEHIERVVHHVRRLEQSAETAVQIHFSAQSHRTNDIMRTLTALTAIFLPLNLIAGIFGMNFEFIPLLHVRSGFWLALFGMGLTAAALGLYFWRKRYLERQYSP